MEAERGDVVHFAPPERKCTTPFFLSLFVALLKGIGMIGVRTRRARLAVQFDQDFVSAHTDVWPAEKRIETDALRTARTGRRIECSSVRGRGHALHHGLNIVA